MKEAEGKLSERQYIYIYIYIYICSSLVLIMILPHKTWYYSMFKYSTVMYIILYYITVDLSTVKHVTIQSLPTYHNWSPALSYHMLFSPTLKDNHSEYWREL